MIRTSFFRRLPHRLPPPPPPPTEVRQAPSDYAHRAAEARAEQHRQRRLALQPMTLRPTVGRHVRWLLQDLLHGCRYWSDVEPAASAVHLKAMGWEYAQ